MSYKINDNCIGCTLCSKNCPVDAIDGVLKEKHIINSKRCVECGVCGNVCPKSAVEDSQSQTVNKVPKKEWKKPIINAEKCTACGMCVDICGFNCLAISYPKFQGDFNVNAELVKEDKCVYCKMCDKICPINAIKCE